MKPTTYSTLTILFFFAFTPSRTHAQNYRAPLSTDSLISCLKHWQNDDYKRCNFDDYSSQSFANEFVTQQLYNLLSETLTTKDASINTQIYLEAEEENIGSL